jgi:carbamoylphosphate synthase large subunit
MGLGTVYAGTVMSVLVVGGGRWQVPLCEFLLSKDFEIVLVDPSPDAECSRFAKAMIISDIRNFDTIFQEVLSMNDVPSMILTDQSDLAIETASRLSHELKLPGIAPETCEIFRNKWHFRRFLEREFGVTFPRSYQIRNKSDLESVLGNLGLPLVVKPADSQSSRGFSIVSTSDQDLKQIVQKALQNTHLDYVLAEQFIPGTEITIEGMSLSGRHHSLTNSSKMHFRPGIASRLDYPARIEPELLAQITKFHNKLIDATGLENALTHAEYLVDPLSGNFAPVEMACRGGGNLISSHIVPWMSGLDTYTILLDALMGNHIDLVPTAKTRCASIQFFEFPGEIAPQIVTATRFSNFACKIISEFNIKAGDKISAATDDRSRHGFAILMAEDLEILETARKQVEQVVYEVF